MKQHERTEKDLVFITSGGRTGTTFFGRNLSRVIDDCWSEHEPDIWRTLGGLTLRQVEDFGLWHMIFGRLAGHAGLRVLGHRKLIGDLDVEIARKRVAQSRHRYHARISESLVVESHYQWWYFADQINSIWPQAKLIAIIRDPRTWIRSWLNHGGRYTSDDKVSWLPPGRLTPEQFGHTDQARDWRSWGVFEKLAWEWNVIYHHLTSAVEASATAGMWRFEDVFGPDPQPVRDLISFASQHGGHQYPVADLSDFTSSVANASRGRARDWQDWTPAQAFHVQSQCGALMSRWGYGGEPEWQRLVHAGQTEPEQNALAG